MSNLIEKVKELELDDKVTIYSQNGLSFTGTVGETSNENVLVIHQPEGKLLLDLEMLNISGLKIYQDTE